MKKLLLIVILSILLFGCDESGRKRLLIDELYERDVSQQEMYFYQGRLFTGVAFDVYDNGEVKWEGNYKKGMLHGEYKEWCYRDPNLVSTLGYFKRISSGDWYHMMDPNYETEIAYGNAPNKFKHGIWKTWHCSNDNILLLEEEYENGEIISKKCWDKEGNKIDCK